MFQYRQILVRLREGESDREIARAGLMGRDKVASLRGLAGREGWLDASQAMPTDEAIAAAVGTARKARSTVSSVEPWRGLVTGWLEQGVQGKTIHAALCRNHGFTGSYSAVHRLIHSIRAAAPAAVTVRLSFAPGDAAQVDFGAGPMLADADGVIRRTWAFVMTLAFSRHQYVEFVWDQTVATWLGCHRRAFEWFGAVPARLIIDNAKCAIIRACRTEPTVQRAYAECAEGYGFRIDACQGKLQSAGVFQGQFRPIGTHREYDAAGKLKREVTYDGRGSRLSERRYDASGAVIRSERFLPDGSREATGR